MDNWKSEAAWKYHNSTKHSLISIRSGTHYLDWSNQPRPYKLYKDLKGLPLPQDLPESGCPALSAISCRDIPRPNECIPNLETLASLLHYSAGITKWLTTSGGPMPFRAAACTGALYHIELYIVSGRLPGLEPGVYQFGAHDSALRCLRAGDYRGYLAEASGGEPGVAQAPLTVVFTTTFWRNAWKYQARTYRHSFWDSGTILANMLAMASAHEIPARIVAGFVDHQVNGLLGLDFQKEVALGLVPLGCAPSMGPGLSPSVEKLNLEILPLSRWEVDYPAIREMHVASSLADIREVARWRVPTPPSTAALPSGKVVPLPQVPLEKTPRDTLERVIKRRGSSRRFERASLSLESLSTILSVSTWGVPMDFLGTSNGTLNDVYLIINAVDGLESGAYIYHRKLQALELLRGGTTRKESGHLALGQELAADAAVNVYFLAKLGPVLERLGSRGYRAAQLEASIMGGKLYLAAYAHHLGATGLTFFDDDVTRFFSPHAQGKSVMFLTALGVPTRRSSRGVGC